MLLRFLTNPYYCLALMAQAFLLIALFHEKGWIFTSADLDQAQVEEFEFYQNPALATAFNFPSFDGEETYDFGEIVLDIQRNQINLDALDAQMAIEQKRFAAEMALIDGYYNSVAISDEALQQFIHELDLSK